MVLVLIPGGAFHMGAQHEGERNVDPLAEEMNESPVHRVELAPWFLAKFEKTQAQWARVTGANPSVHNAVSQFVVDDAAPRHPVESVDWWSACSVLHKLGLVLPTESQWEYAARAGSSTPWPHGATIKALLSPPAANLADAASAAAIGAQGWSPTPGLDDGFVMHAPVGSFGTERLGSARHVRQRGRVVQRRLHRLSSCADARNWRANRSRIRRRRSCIEAVASISRRKKRARRTARAVRQVGSTLRSACGLRACSPSGEVREALGPASSS